MEITQLVIDEATKAPSPLDPAIANVFLNSISNRYADGFDLEVSAFFGTEAITLTGENLEVDLTLSIKKASLELHFKHCVASAIVTNEPEFSDEWIIVESLGDEDHILSEAKAASRAGVSGGLRQDGIKYNANTSVSGSVSGAVTHATDALKQGKRQTRNWSKNSSTSLLVGKLGRSLSGNEVDRYRGWRVQPDVSTEYSAVTAVLKARPDWLSFTNVDETSLSGGFGGKIKNLLRSKKSAQKALFVLLLEHLARQGLQTDAKTKDATLAVAIQVLRPDTDKRSISSELPYIVPTQPSKRLIPVESEHVAQFLRSSEEENRLLLTELGVPTHSIVDAMGPNLSEQPLGAEKEKSVRGLFTARSTPLKAIELFELLLKSTSPFPLTAVPKKFGKTAHTDLKNLGLIDPARKHLTVINDGSGSSAEELVRAAALSTATLQTTTVFLRMSPKTTGSKICDIVAAAHGKTYSSKASKTRVGNGLKRWAYWLDPSLIDPDGGSMSEMYRATAQSQTTNKGRTSVATERNVELAQSALDAGRSMAAIGRLIDVNPNTIGIWIKKGILKRHARD